MASAVAATGNGRSAVRQPQSTAQQARQQVRQQQQQQRRPASSSAEQFDRPGGDGGASGHSQRAQRLRKPSSKAWASGHDWLVQGFQVTSVIVTSMSSSTLPW
jgi:hypothetical protein